MLLLVFGLIASLTDLRSRKIYNSMNLAALLAGLIAYGVLLSPLAILTGSLPGMLVGLLLLLPFYLVGGMSAGDVKYMAVNGSILGLKGALLAVGTTLVVGSMLAILYVLYTQGFRSLISRLKTLFAAGVQMIGGVAPGQTAMPVLSKDPRGQSLNKEDSFPYAIAIASGSLIAQVLVMKQAGSL